MPEMDGPAFHRQMRTEHPELAERIVFMTAHAKIDEYAAFLRDARASAQQAIPPRGPGRDTGTHDWTDPASTRNKIGLFEAEALPAGLELGPGEAEPPGRLGLVAAGPIEPSVTIRCSSTASEAAPSSRAAGAASRNGSPSRPGPRPRREPESLRHDDTGPVQGAAASAVMSFSFNPASWCQPNIDAVPVETNASMCG
jgi:CheY-like chemotaxis protein